jgi:hypothetical protein
VGVVLGVAVDEGLMVCDAVALRLGESLGGAVTVAVGVGVADCVAVMVLVAVAVGVGTAVADSVTVGVVEGGRRILARLRRCRAGAGW